MGKKTDLIGFCGLYCGACPNYTQRIANLAENLRNQLHRYEFDKYADFLAKEPRLKAFENYEKFCELLETVARLRCRGCKLGGWSRSCKIRKCVQKKEFDGCWQCAAFEACEKLKVLEVGDDFTHLKNLRKIKRHGPTAFVKAQKT